MQLPIPALRGRNTLGFTLVEVMVAMSILVLLLICFSQIVGSVSKVTAEGRHRLDSDAAARIALDLIAGDLGTRLRRPDTDFFLQKNAKASDAFYFYSEAPAFSGTMTADTVACVGYRVTGSTGLERLGAGLPLSTGTDGLALYPTRIGLDKIEGLIHSGIHFQPLSKEVFCMEMEFLKRDGTFIDCPPTRAATGKPAYTYVSVSGTLAQIPAGQLYDWDDISAIVITLACLDRERQSLLAPDELTQLADSFETAVATSGTRPCTYLWGEMAEKATFPINAKSAKGAVRVYRRYFPLQ